MITKAMMLTALLFGSAGTAWAQEPQTGDDPMDQPAEPAPGEEQPAEPAPEPQPAEPVEPMAPETEPAEPVTVVPEVEEEDRGAYGMISDIGLAFSIGGGVNAFTDSDMRDFADTGGNWNARVAVGTKEVVGLEVAYIGSAQGIDALGLDEDAILLSNGAEAVARVNFLAQSSFQPFAFGGVGWRRYTLTNEEFNTSSVQDEDDVLEIPVGLGAAFKYQGFNIDLRTMFRLATENDLVMSPTGDQADAPDLHTWGAQLDVGWEF